MTNNKNKILSIALIVFSLFLFTAPIVDTICFDAGSEKVLDFDNETEPEYDDDKKEATFLNTYSFYNLFTSNEKPLYHVCFHSHHNNSSLLKPPILHS
ncbi:hypothetical protein [Sulfurimonas paralvinellae]|uniref:Uncharacterized protein n=1 Tax=Sulfurimonas paralvinellae TaxID=317658 RepID=A0A7M1B9L1_9BACT|nr:hypothetical protein [Sulfurimonas paralvinellae]QOP46394.1 hypothetical protein FM071_08860 [Sulfurimonas paralvinellae]